MNPDADAILVFVYGTLKRGERNHDAFCGGAMTTEETTVRGRLYDLPAGYPALVVPEEDVHALGTADPSRDAAEGGRHSAVGAGPAGDLAVFGELLTFDDPEIRLPVLDTLEGFVPGDPSSPYCRVLIPTFTENGATQLAWAYVVNEASGRRLPSGRWSGTKRTR